MSAIVSVSAPANIAFIKYWGVRDAQRVIPANPSISMTLSECRSQCSAQWLPEPGEDEVYLAGPGGLQPAPAAFRQRVVAHLQRLRGWAGQAGHFRIATRNSFPSAAGLASSASGFAALTLAATGALGRQLSPVEASRLARQSGSGSAARSVLGGYVQWPGPGQATHEEQDSYAQVIAPAAHWPLADVIAVVETQPKEVTSLEGHRRATSSPHFATRQGLLPARLEAVRQAIQARDLEALGAVLEEEAVELHLIAMSSRPPIFYWQPATLAVLAAVRQLREDGCPAFATMDAGANVHVICAPAQAAAVAQCLEVTPGVQQVLRDRVGEGPSLQAEPLL